MDPAVLLDRVRAAKDRAQVVSVLTDCVRFAELSSAQNQLTVGSFATLLNALISRTASDFLGVLTKQEIQLLFHEIFLKGPTIDAFLSVTQGVGTSVGDAYKTGKLLALLDRLEHDRLSPLFCVVTARTADRDAKWQDVLSTVVQALVSLPEKIANVTKGAMSRQFHSDRHLRLLVVAIRSALETAHGRLAAGEDADLRFAANILCKLCVVGSGSDSVRPVVSWLSRKMREQPADCVWDRIAERLLTGEPNRRLLELILTETVLAARCEHLGRLLGDSIIRDNRVEYLLTHKLLLIRHFDNERYIPEKVVAYLSGGERRRPLLCSTLLKLLDVWADAGALAHSSTEQRQYLCRSVIIFAKCTTTDERARLRLDVVQRVVIGAQHHLGCVDTQRRQQGMFVAECLMQWFGDTTEKDSAELRFDYEKDDECLQELRAVVDRDFDQANDSDNEQQLAWLDDTVLPMNKSDEQLAPTLVDDPIDSDDDLTPFEIPADELSFASGVTDKRSKPPVYIADCFEHLLEEKDYSKFEAAFFAVETMIRRRTVGFRDIAVQLSERLVFLEDRFTTKDFEHRRQAALTACCVMEPVVVALHLCAQFYARNYTISQRLLLLQSIASAAQELSAVDKRNESGSSSACEQLVPSEALPVWRQVIDARLVGKTKRFRTVVLPTSATVNQFAAVCDNFFFPLLKPSTGAHLDLMGRDYLLLGRLLFTLGTVLSCAENCPRVLEMAVALAEMLWPLRFHDERFVRQAVLYCYCTIATTVPSRLLALEFAESVGEWVAWITSVADNDSSSECQALATKTASLLASRLDDSFRNVLRVE